MGITSQRACARTRMKILNPLIANFDNATGYSKQIEEMAIQTCEEGILLKVLSGNHIFIN